MVLRDFALVLRSLAPVRKEVTVERAGRRQRSSDEACDTILQILGDSGPGRNIVVNPPKLVVSKGALMYSFKKYLLSTVLGAPCAWVLAAAI